MKNAMLLNTTSQARKYFPEQDFYETPSYAIEDLLKKISFQGKILEPASGRGAISKVLESKGFQVESFDIRDNEVYGTSNIDFLTYNDEVDNIITNPPYILAEEFVKHALEISKGKTAMILRTLFLEGKSRYKNIFEKNPPWKVIVYSGRVRMENDLESKQGGMQSYSWFIWDKNYSGPTLLEFIENK